MLVLRRFRQLSTRPCPKTAHHRWQGKFRHSHGNWIIVEILRFFGAPALPKRSQVKINRMLELLRTQSRLEQFIYPADAHRLTDQSERVGFAVDGPHPAILVQGEDVPGALVGIHETLFDAGINVYATTGVSAGGGSFGYVIHVRPTDFERAAELLGL